MRILPVIAALTLTACATAPTPEQLALAEQINSTIPTCTADQECRVKWGAARSWVLANAGYRIQTYADDFLETYPSVGGSTRLAVRINRVPDGRAWRIEARVWCDNIFGCDQPPAAALLDLHRVVSSSWTP